MTAAATGWGAVEDGKLRVETVAPTSVGAKTNALLTIFGVVALRNWSDEKVDDVWRSRARVKDGQVSVVRVSVRPML